MALVMLRNAGRFLAAYFALAFSMCAVASALALVFGAWRLDQFIAGFMILFVLCAMVIPLRALLPFTIIWILLHRYHHLRLWHFLFLGGVCGLVVFVTLPNPDDPMWSVRWNDFQHMKPGDWGALAGLIFSGGVGGWLARFVGTHSWTTTNRWNASNIETRQQR